MATTTRLRFRATISGEYSAERSGAPGVNLENQRLTTAITKALTRELPTACREVGIEVEYVRITAIKAGSLVYYFEVATTALTSAAVAVAMIPDLREGARAIGNCAERVLNRVLRGQRLGAAIVDVRTAIPGSSHRRLSSQPSVARAQSRSESQDLPRFVWGILAAVLVLVTLLVVTLNSASKIDDEVDELKKQVKELQDRITDVQRPARLSAQQEKKLDAEISAIEAFTRAIQNLPRVSQDQNRSTISVPQAPMQALPAPSGSN